MNICYMCLANIAVESHPVVLSNYMQNEIFLRDLNSTEVDALIAFYHGLSEAVVAKFQPFGRRVTRSLILTHLESAEAERDISVGLVDKNGHILGHAFILTSGNNKPVFGIGIDESFQGQGWGRKMAESVLAKADMRRISTVTLTVLKSNQRAKAIYEKLGFSLQGEETFCQPNDSFYMERPCDGTRKF